MLSHDDITGWGSVAEDGAWGTSLPVTVSGVSATGAVTTASTVTNNTLAVTVLRYRCSRHGTIVDQPFLLLA